MLLPLLYGAALGTLGALGVVALGYGGLRGPVDWMYLPRAHAGNRARRAVALTFDDGPDPEVTPALLDVLRDANVRATFFVTGQQAAAHPGLIARMVSEGHQLGNHTWSHRCLPFCASRTVRAEINATDRAISDVTGTAPTWMRPPWGARAPWTLRELRALQKRVALWDVNSFDWRGESAEVIAARVLRNVRPGSVVLFHDRHPRGDQTVAAVQRLIIELRARSLEMVTVEELLS